MPPPWPSLSIPVRLLSLLLCLFSSGLRGWQEHLFAYPLFPGLLCVRPHDSQPHRPGPRWLCLLSPPASLWQALSSLGLDEFVLGLALTGGQAGRRRAPSRASPTGEGREALPGSHWDDQSEARTWSLGRWRLGVVVKMEEAGVRERERGHQGWPRGGRAAGQGPVVQEAEEGSGVRLPGFESCPHSFLTVTWANHVTSLSLGFLVCTMGILSDLV